MPENWKTYKLGDLIEINKRSINRDFLFEEIEYIDTSSITENKLTDVQRLKTADAPSRAKRLVKNNDIIYSTVRPIQRHYGFIKNAKPNTVVSTGFVVLTPKAIYPKFLYYYLSRNEIVGFLNGIAESNTTTFPAFNASLFDRLEIEIPESIEEQRRIAEILSALDEKIELNLEMNRTLERIAQATFKHWFVDFQFPGFNGELVDGLPKGWRIGRLADEFNITMGQSPPGTSYNHSGQGIIFFQGRTDFGFRFPTERIYTTAPTRFAKKFDTLVSVRAPVGDMNIAVNDCCIGRGLSAVIHKKGYASYTYYLLNSLENIFKGFEGEGTVFGSINKTNFENIEMTIADDEIVSKFEDAIKPIDDRIYTNSIEVKILTQIRDSLLPKLMSGKIRVAE